MSNFKGRKHTEEAKAAIGAAKRGVKQSPEHIEKKRLARIGKKHSDETKRRMSDAQKARFATAQLVVQQLTAATTWKHPRNR